MYFEPENSPWGQVDHCETICPGVYSVRTPSHGGIMIRSDRAAEILSASARRIGFREHGYLCFEEDCDAPVALRELMDQAKARHYENADLDILSMGMSGSYEAAILEGATLVRVGTAIYGERDYANKI